MMLSFPGMLLAGTKAADTVPDVRLLKSRIDDFYRSLASQDFARLLEVLSPVTRACDTAADLERDSGFKMKEGDQLKSWTIETIKSVATSEGDQEVECTGRHYSPAAAAEVIMVVKSWESVRRTQG